jgi:hypothetical protein
VAVGEGGAVGVAGAAGKAGRAGQGGGAGTAQAMTMLRAGGAQPADARRSGAGATGVQGGSHFVVEQAVAGHRALEQLDGDGLQGACVPLGRVDDGNASPMVCAMQAGPVDVGAASRFCGQTPRVCSSGCQRAPAGERGERSNQSGSCVSWLADMRSSASCWRAPARAAGQSAGYRPA